MALATLPGELYTAIVEQLEPSLWTPVVLALSRAIPSAPIPIQLLFYSIRIKHPQQAAFLYLRLSRALDNAGNAEVVQDPCTTWVKELSVETWTADADVISNVVRLLPNLSSLNLRIGPSNFSPEHLEQLFENPIGSLARLSLRFRPYVKKASYYQFHKGVYFDSTLLAIAKWPPQKIPAISIVQDPQDTNHDATRKPAFAQPIVFYRLDHLSVLIHYPSLAPAMKALRLRVPSRPVARALCVSPGQTEEYYYAPNLSPASPSLEFLDLSTCGVIETELDMILARFRNLKHIVMDGCAVLRAELRQGEWGALGKRCALVGVKRARDREKELKAWLEERWFESRQTLGSDAGPARMVVIPARAEPPRQRPGRRGLATATISLRDRPSENLNQASSHLSRDPNAPKPIPKTRILPSVPRLETIAISTTIEIEFSKHSAIRAEFEAGWAEGIAQLAVTRARMRTGSRNGVRLLRFSGNAEGQGNLTHGMEGLEDVDPDDDDSFTIANTTTPILCLAGSEGNEHHVVGCGHSVGCDIWSETPAQNVPPPLPWPNSPPSFPPLPPVAQDMDPPQKSSGSRLPMAKITALTRLKSLTDTVTSRRQNSGVVFPPASWEIDRLVIDSNNGWSQTKSETPSSGEEAVAELAETVVSTEVPVALEPEPVTFAQRIRELIVSLPLPGTSKPSKPPVADVADAEVLKAGDGSAGPPVPPGVDQELVMMLCSEEVMNGDEEEGREEGAERPSVWSILSKMRWKGKTKETGGPERSDFHGQDGLMMYAPLEPANDSTLELAEVCSISNASIPPGSPVPEQPSEDIEWMPSTTQISVYATWWGYRLYLPPPVMATLDSVSLKATAQGAMVTGALKWLLDKVPDMLVPPQFKPALALLRRLGPVVGYVGVFVAWSWTRIKNHDRGNGVVLMATWLLPVALVPMAWDVGDIYGPVLLPKPEDRKPAPSEGDGNKEHETKKTKKGFWHL